MGWPQQQEKVASPVEPVAISEVCDGLDLKLLRAIEPRRPEAVERWLPPAVPNMPSPVFIAIILHHGRGGNFDFASTIRVRTPVAFSYVYNHRVLPVIKAANVTKPATPIMRRTTRRLYRVFAGFSACNEGKTT
jgi:hypothetical protein